MCVCVCVYACVGACVFVFVCVCVCVHVPSRYIDADKFYKLYALYTTSLFRLNAAYLFARARTTLAVII